ncbi:hypothetical protein [Escherichia coli]|uniref:hypothetical protein n=1 Tax=Escherichia coli TaxID=562 RepID=UPI002FC99607
MIEFIAEHINTVSTLISALAALLTAVATFFLWRVTRLLADETKRMVDASVQPHVVVTLEPNSWAAFYFDINIANTGNAPAYDIEIGFNPPLVNAEHRKNIGIPFSKVSVLKTAIRSTAVFVSMNRLKIKFILLVLVGLNSRAQLKESGMSILMIWLLSRGLAT